LQLMLGLDQFVDQRRGGREADPAFLPAGRHRQHGQQVGLAGAAVPYTDDGLGRTRCRVARVDITQALFQP
jgi:hypothetical protein